MSKPMMDDFYDCCTEPVPTVRQDVQRPANGHSQPLAHNNEIGFDAGIEIEDTAWTMLTIQGVGIRQDIVLLHRQMLNAAARAEKAVPDEDRHFEVGYLAIIELLRSKGYPEISVGAAQKTFRALDAWVSDFQKKEGLVPQNASAGN